MMPGLKSKLKRGERVFGLFVVSYGIQNAEALAHSGFDFLAIDVEHSPSSLPHVHEQLAALNGTNTATIVRISGLESSSFKQYLDLGVDGVMVPNVSSAAMAQDAVRFARYPNVGGVRGIGGTIRASRYGRDKDYMSSASERVTVLVQIESREGLANLDQICKVDGIDVVFFGPNDLAADMGLMGQPEHPDVIAAVQAGIRRAKDRGVAAGVLASEAVWNSYHEAGVDMVILGSDLGLLVKSADALVAKIHEGGANGTR